MDEANEDLPASPCRAQRRLSCAKGERLSIASVALSGGSSIATTLPSTPPDSPGRYRQVWLCLKQREEELEEKQQQLEEWDFELQEEKRQHRESRLFLARKMSELEARELRAAKEEERRLSRVSTRSGSQATSLDRTPPSASKHTRNHLLETPPRRLNLGEESEGPSHSEQTLESSTTTAVHDEQQCGGKRAGNQARVGMLFLIAAKVCILIGIVLSPNIPLLTRWLSPHVDVDGSNCTAVLNETQTQLSSILERHRALEEEVAVGSVRDDVSSHSGLSRSQSHSIQPSAFDWGWEAMSLWARSFFGWP